MQSRFFVGTQRMRARQQLYQAKKETRQTQKKSELIIVTN